jgi:hypothetical protein
MSFEILTEKNGAAENVAADFSVSCPLPISTHKEIVLAHGSGGKLSQRLMQETILPNFKNPLLDLLHDGAIFR